jgi:hypothetical protein
MSLVITSSNQDKYDVKSMGMGIEQPASYMNNLKSSLVIPKNSEVAVQSVKFQREGFILSNELGFFVYFGNEMSVVSSQDPTTTSTQRPLLIVLENGTYSALELRQHIQDRMTDVIRQTYPNVESISCVLKVNATSGDFEGFTWTYIQYGTSSGYSLGIANWTPQINASTLVSNLGSMTDVDPYIFPANTYTDAIDSLSGTTIKADSGTGTGNWCSAIGTTYPIGTATGVCEYDISGLNGAGSGFLVGMTRPLTTDNIDEDGTYDQIGWGRSFNEEEPTLYSGFDTYTPGLTTTPAEDPNELQFLWCDFGVYWKNGQDLEVVESNAFKYADEQSNATEIIAPHTALDGIQYWAGTNQPASVITNASMEAEFYDRVKFEIINEVIYVSMRETKAKTYQVLLGANNTTAGKRFKPLGLSTQSLYPIIMIEKDTDSIELMSTTTNLQTNDKQVYKTPRTYGYEGISKLRQAELRSRGLPTINLPAGRNLTFFGQSAANLINHHLDTGPIYQISVGSSLIHTYKGVNGSGGQGYHWTMIFGEGLNYTNVPVIRQFVNMVGGIGDQMGFSVDVIDQGQYATITAHNKVVFESTKTPQYANSSLFVRLMDFTQDSYNTTKGSVSKILYHIPRFDNQGNTRGPMFFEPAEKTYVKLNNANPIQVSTMKVELCDQHEVLATDLRGNTIVVFHFRESDTGVIDRRMLPQM